MLKGAGIQPGGGILDTCLRGLGLMEKKLRPRSGSWSKKIGLQIGKTKSGGLEVNWELEIIDTVTGLYTYETKKKTNRGGERLLAFLKRQANVIGLYILSQNRLCYRKEYFARIRRDG